MSNFGSLSPSYFGNSVKKGEQGRGPAKDKKRQVPNSSFTFAGGKYPFKKKKNNNKSTFYII